MNMEDKIAIIASGGGMKCSYSVGVILALIEKYEFTEPDIAIGGSGSAGTLAYYVAKQYDSIKNIWSNLLSTNKFINTFRFWRAIDIDYLIDVVFKVQDPLSVDKIFSSKIHFLVPSTNYENGKVEYFSNYKKDNIFEALRAAKALPIVYGKTTSIKNKRYCDTSNSSSIEINTLKALRLGANKLIIINNSSNSCFKDFILKLWSLSKNSEFRKNYSRYSSKRENFWIPRNIKVMVFSPKKKLKITRLNNNKGLLKETIAQGYSEVLSNKEIKSFL